MLEFLKKLFGSKKEESEVYIPPAYTPFKKTKSTNIDELMTTGSPVFVEDKSEQVTIDTDMLPSQKQETVKPKSDYTIEEEWEIFEEDSLFGYKNENGDKVIPAKFTGAESFSKGYAVVDMNEGTGMINNKGEFILEPIYDYVLEEKNGYVKIEKDSLFGLAKTDGTLIIKPQYADTGDFSEGLLWAANEDYSGYVDLNNRTVIDFKFDWCGNFSEGLASATQYATEEGKKDHYGYIDKTGKFVIELEDYDEAGEFIEGLAPLSVNDKFGFINTKGTFICQPVYFAAGNFYQGLSCVQMEEGEKWGYADRTGKLVIPCKYDRNSDEMDQRERDLFIEKIKQKFLQKKP
jgi:hypothetical protein